MNSAHSTDWLPGIVVLCISMFGAIVYLLTSKRLKNDAPSPETTDDLDARYQALLAQLREHIANKHLVPTDEFERERTRLETSAAETLRARAGKQHEETKRQARAEKRAAAEPTLASRHPVLIGALVGGGVVAFFAFLGFQLTQASAERPPERAAPMAQPQQDSKLEALAGRVQAKPDDVDAVVDLSIYLIRRQAFEDARPLVDRATLLDPYHPKGRVGRAVMRALEGDIPGAMTDLEALATKYPEAYDARMFAGMLAMEVNDSPRAIVNLEAYVTLAPASEQPPMMRMALNQLKQQAASPSP